MWDAGRYHRRVGTQIAVRLPTGLVNFLDRAVADGVAPSRAAIVTLALEREMRRVLAEKDAEILRQQGPPSDLDALVDWTASTLSANATDDDTSASPRT